MKIEGAVALVTGANRGIGAQIAAALLRAGAGRVHAAARDPKALAAFVASDPERVRPLALDVRDAAQVAATAARLGDVTILINNAGINRYLPFISSTPIEGAREEMETNYFGTLSMCRAFAPVLRRNGGGAIVNLLAISARVNLATMGTLSASKAAAFSLTQGVRAELRNQGTLVMGVMPGAVDTDMARGYQGSKTSPQEVAAEIVEALRNGIDEIYPGEFARGVAEGLQQDARLVEHQFAGYAP